jgi:hypothetical protein
MTWLEAASSLLSDETAEQRAVSSGFRTGIGRVKGPTAETL